VEKTQVVNFAANIVQKNTKQITNMKIDKLIKLLDSDTEEILIITNKKNIDSFFEDIEKESIGSNHAVFNMHNPIGVRGVSRKGIDFYFGELKDLESIKFKN
jgi:hypothetical protein